MIASKSHATMHTFSPIDRLTLRHALGVFPTGVTVVTALADDGACVGLTVNSFNSLSLDPPLITWALIRRSVNLRAFQEAEHFAVNILADDQVAISRRFASHVADKFRGIPTHPGIAGTPLIEGCAAHIECRTHSSHPGGDHILFIGKVERVQTHDRAPLVFVGGRYRSAGVEVG